MRLFNGLVLYFLQLRVRNNTCEVNEHFSNTIEHCFGSYRPSREDHAPFGPNGAFTFQSEKELEGRSYWGVVDTYVFESLTVITSSICEEYCL